MESKNMSKAKAVSTNKVKKSREDWIFDIILYTIGVLLIIITLYPMYFIIIASFSDPAAVSNGQIMFLPKGVNFKGYKQLASYAKLWTGYRNYGNTCDNCCQYSGFLRAFQKAFVWKKIFHSILPDPDVLHRWSDPDLPGSTEISSAGYLLGYGCSVLRCNVLHHRRTNVLQQQYPGGSLGGGAAGWMWIPWILLQDCASAFQSFHRNDRPFLCSKPLERLVYIRSESLQPLQIVLRSILVGNQTMSAMSTGAAAVEAKQMADLIKYAIIVVSSAPIMCMYPLVQKYFNQGVMLGSLKG